MTFFRLRRDARLALGQSLLSTWQLLFPWLADGKTSPRSCFACADGVGTGSGRSPVNRSRSSAGGARRAVPGLMTTFLKAHRATLIIEDEGGHAVLSIGPPEFATLWGDPESFPSGFEDVTCAGPTGQSAGWSYLLDAGLPEGTYIVVLEGRCVIP